MGNAYFRQHPPQSGAVHGLDEVVVESRIGRSILVLLRQRPLRLTLRGGGGYSAFEAPVMTGA